MLRTHHARGTSLVEAAISTVLLGFAIGATLVTMTAATDTVASGESQNAASEQTRKVFSRLAAELLESDIATVDTLYRSFSSGSGGGSKYMWSQGHFHDYGSKYLKQCYNATSPWNTRSDGTDRQPRSFLSRYYYQYSSDGGVTNSTYYYKVGRAWVNIFPGVNKCPIDGTYLSQGIYLDGVKFFSARKKGTNQFVTGEYSALQLAKKQTALPDWQKIVIYAPYYDEATRNLQLRRYVVYKDDIYDPQSPHTTLWQNNNPKGVPTMIDLFDFGTDGTQNGTPDGSVPLTPAKSDADYDYYNIYSYQSSTYTDAQGNQVTYPAGAYIYLYKVLGNGSSTPYRYAYLYIDRKTGKTTGYFYFRETAGSWSNYFTVTRSPTIIANHLLDIDFSTAVDNPYDATSNPNGIQNKNVVRITVCLDRQAQQAGGRRRQEVVYVSTLTLRNSPSLTGYKGATK